VACLYGALWLLMRRSRFGRAARACADDARMAAMCGVDVDRTIALTFVLGAAYAGIAGFVILVRYGGVGFYDGFLLGFKALTAAIIGGIGSVPGAMLAGVIVGLAEAFAVQLVGAEWRAAVAFVILVLVLLFRPQGIFGRAA
jgi:branched-chain amino acid transport system permease protein